MRVLSAVGVVLALLTLELAPSAQQPRLALDHAAIAKRIVEQLALRPGERVVALAHPGMLEGLIPPLRYEVMRAGGVDLGAVLVPPIPIRQSWDRTVFEKGTRDARTAYKAMFRDVDAAIMMPGATPADAAYAAMQDWLREGRGRTVDVLCRYAEFYLCSKKLAIRNASYSSGGQPNINLAFLRSYPFPLPPLAEQERIVADVERRFADAMRGHDVHVTSRAGTDLRFRIGDRAVNLQDGDASAARAARAKVLVDREVELPAGVVRVAPLEDSVEGTIAFPPSEWDGRPVDGLKLRFSKGVVVDIAAASGRDAVEAEMTRAGAAGRRFREFALGLNPMLAVPDSRPWIPYYGYGAGVVRLSLGDNTELGGTISGGYVRWNFFTDVTVAAGDTVWVRDGKLVVR